MHPVKEWLREARELTASWDHYETLLERVRLRLQENTVYQVTDLETGQVYIVSCETVQEAKAYVSLLLGLQPNNNSKRLKGKSLRRKLEKELEEWY